METTFYPGSVNTPRVPNIYSHSTMMKKDINLNLDDHKSNPLRDTDGLLNSPDLGLLKLTTPDLERLIIQSNGLVTTVNPSSQFLYPKSASDEQEFAEGFVKALEDLHKQNQLSEAGCVDRLELLGAANSMGSGLQTSDLPVYTTLNGYASSPLGTTINYSTDTIPFPPPPSHLASVQLQQQQQAAAALSRLQSAGLVKDEPQTVPDMQSFGDSPPMSPNRHGQPGAHQGGEEKAKEQGSRLQVPQEKTGEDFSAGGQGQEPENAKHRAGIHSQRPQGSSGSAEAEGDEPCQQWVPAFTKPGPSLLKPLFMQL
ncbi:hypothetical protein CesoFtcFv8_014868 [Champsocephalus esox]|uniref:Jun-like transcription factor domain-containing protein n=1 Tax=Champsocephalus esox TaxID=159716 RepID=A0AAN8BP72_9TELE|nr:hypothetical protein CesoFtcFv8_014868 [Champsocephalus esox]